MSGNDEFVDAATLRIHATTVALGPHAVILRGTSGAGKSDLALRFLADPGSLQALGLAESSQQRSYEQVRRLVADDQTVLSIENGCLLASPPPAMAGRVEVRGVGIIAVACVPSAQVRLVVDLVAPMAVDRYPLDPQTVTLLGRDVPLRRLAPFEASAPLKLALLLAAVTGGRS